MLLLCPMTRRVLASSASSSPIKKLKTLIPSVSFSEEADRRYSADKHRAILFTKLVKAAKDRSPGGRGFKMAEQLFEEMGQQNFWLHVAVYNQMIFAAGTALSASKAFAYYNKLKKAGLKPNEQTFNFMFRAYGRGTGESALARVLWLKQEEMPRYGIELNVPLASVFLHCLIQHSGQPDQGLALLREIQEKNISPDISLYSEAIRFFGVQCDEQRMKSVWAELCSKFTPDIRAYNTYLSALARCGARESAKLVLLELARKAEDAAFGNSHSSSLPDAWTAAIAIKLCDTDDEVREFLLRTLHKWRIVPDLPLLHALIADISHRPNTKLAAELLPNVYSMIQKNRLTATATTYDLSISAFGRTGHTDFALKLFEEMKDKGIRPRKATFTSLLVACLVSNPPRLDRAFHALDEMRVQQVPVEGGLLNKVKALQQYTSKNAKWKESYDVLMATTRSISDDGAGTGHSLQQDREANRRRRKLRLD